MNSMISISSITSNKDEVIITGINLDNIIMGDLEAEFKTESFRFDLKNKGNVCYLYKIVVGRLGKTDAATNMQQMLDLLVSTSSIVTINDSFKIRV